LVLNGHKFKGSSRALVVRFSQGRVNSNPSTYPNHQDALDDTAAPSKLSNEPSEGVECNEDDGLCWAHQPQECQSQWFQNSSEGSNLVPLISPQLFSVVYVPVIAPVTVRYDVVQPVVWPSNS